MQKNSKKTFWPYAILISIGLIILSCVATIIFSLDYPVYFDDFYLEKYEKVDKNYNEIQKSQKEFDSKYKISFEQKDVKVGEEFYMTIFVDSLKSVENLDAKILLTRPETSEFDKEIKSKFSSDKFLTENFKVQKKGRWQLMVKISDNNSTGFYKFEFLAI